MSELLIAPEQDRIAPVRGRTRWRRFVVMFVPSVLVVGGIIVAMATGAIGASFAVSGQSFKISADHLHGTGFRQFSGVDVTAGGSSIPVATTVIDDASITNLCQSVNVPNPFGMKIVLRVEAGGGGHPASAKGLVIGMTNLQGNATFTNIQIGRDAGQLSGNSALSGTFGQSADAVDIDNLKQSATSTSAGTFALIGLDLAVQTGQNAHECF
ncbi:MAG TPA: DUF6230 family protein [Micromonosporaceae bacterium]